LEYATQIWKKIDLMLVNWTTGLMYAQKYSDQAQEYASHILICGPNLSLNMLIDVMLIKENLVH